jgi:hypothetical protein
MTADIKWTSFLKELGEKTLQEFVCYNLSHHTINVLVDRIKHDINNPLLIPTTAP